MKKTLLGFVLSLALALPSVVLASDGTSGFQVTTVDMIRYEAGLASVAVQPVELVCIPFGKEDARVGGHALEAGHRTEGVPYAFRAMSDGTVWVLDTINGKLKQFEKDGKCLTTISWKNHPEGKPPIIRDFAPAPGNGFYLLCASDGKVEMIDGKGNGIVEIEGLADAWNIGSDPKGNVLVNHPVMRALLRFNPQGEIVEKYEDPDLTVWTDQEGHPFGMRGDDQNAVLFKAKTASPATEIELAKFPLDLPKERKARYVSRQVLGVDAKQRIYVELTACDQEGVIHLNRLIRLSPAGKETGRLEFFSKPYLAPDLPRRATVMPDGRILGFKMDDHGWSLITWQIP